MAHTDEKQREFPPQEQPRPGKEGEMTPEPRDEMRGYRGSGKLDGKVALVTGGDSGIGRAVCAAFAKEGADVAIAYLSEHEDAEHTRGLVEAEGRRAITISCDVQREEECTAAPDEIAPSYVFFASGELSSYYTGEVLGPIGGETLPG